MHSHAHTSCVALRMHLRTGVCVCLPVFMIVGVERDVAPHLTSGRGHRHRSNPSGEEAYHILEALAGMLAMGKTTSCAAD